MFCNMLICTERHVVEKVWLKSGASVETDLKIKLSNAPDCEFVCRTRIVQEISRFKVEAPDFWIVSEISPSI